jgi:hypothetical protein
MDIIDLEIRFSGVPKPGSRGFQSLDPFLIRRK